MLMGKTFRILIGILVVLFAIGVATIGVRATSISASTACTLPNGCILREHGENARWWADSVRRGTCRGHTGKDWIVTYRVNNRRWRNADQTKVRFYAAWWSLARWWKWTGKVQVEDNSLSSGGGITICLSGILPESHVKGTYLWIKP